MKSAVTSKLTTLPSGLRVVTTPMKDRESAAIGIWLKVGARYEEANQSGISHFMEHLVFKGTKKFTNRQIKENIEGKGGVLNAFTDEECTCYFAKVLEDDLYSALDVLGEMCLAPVLDPSEINQERMVIIEEIKMYLDQPGHRIMDLTNEMMWPNQPMGKMITGTPKTLNSIHQQHLKSFLKRHYSAKNTVVSVAGRFDEAKLMAAIAKVFKTMPKGEVKSPEISFHRHGGPYVRFENKDSEQTHICLAVPCYPRTHHSRYGAEILSVILGGNMSSRLFQALREDKGLAYEIKAGYSKYSDVGMLSIHAGVAEKKLYDALECIMQVIKGLQTKKVPEEEFERAKNYCRGALRLHLEGTINQMMWQGESVVTQGELRSIKRILEKIDGVTAGEVEQIARTLFAPKFLHLAVISKDCQENKMRKILKDHI